MKIEYLNKGASDCPLLRIFHFEQSELVQLQLKCFELSQGRGHKNLWAGPPHKESSEDCGIFSMIVDQDRGLVPTKVEGLFVLCLTNESWLAAAEKLQPLLDHPAGFQWLSEQGEIRLLVSHSGAW